MFASVSQRKRWEEDWGVPVSCDRKTRTPAGRDGRNARWSSPNVVGYVHKESDVFMVPIVRPSLAPIAFNPDGEEEILSRLGRDGWRSDLG